MVVIDFNTAKIFAETFSNFVPIAHNIECHYIYAIDSEKLLWFGEMEADEYMLNKKPYYNAYYIQDIIEYFEKYHKWAIYITPRFDGFDNAQIDTYFEIYKVGNVGGKDYSSDAHVGSRWESANRAIVEVCNLIKKEKNE